MLAIRYAEERGTASLDWLDSRHSFSFGHYHDPSFMGFGPLRVINEDRIKPGQGFSTHAHRDMEIVSYVLEGALRHQDSIGIGSVIRPGEVQRMTAGTGVRHSELNHSKTDPVHFLQIWIVPERTGLEPSYEQRYFSDDDKRGRLCLIGSRDGREGSITVHQDVDLYAAVLGRDDTLSHELAEGRQAWIQIARGTAAVNSEQLYTGDGAAIIEQLTVDIVGTAEDTEVLLFDLAWPQRRATP